MAILLCEILGFVGRAGSRSEEALDLMALYPDKPADANDFQSPSHDHAADGLFGDVEVNCDFLDPQKTALIGRDLLGGSASPRT